MAIPDVFAMGYRKPSYQSGGPQAMTPESTQTTAARVPGETGIWVLILGDLAMFGLFFATFVYYRNQDLAVFQAARTTLSPALGALNTVLLLTSSLFMARGVNAYRAGAAATARRQVLLAWLLGLGFVVDKVVEYRDLGVQGLGPGSNDFFLFYFMLTGIHLAHVLIGLGVLWWIRGRMTRPDLTHSNISAVECGALFWHMVDLLWIVLFTLLYLLA
jgi:nitric oxide reductase NorE protein